jgi:regulator of PEP synthase PpsR (kinase-PPPase family)
MELDPTAVGVSIVAPILAYLKIREERLKTSDKREAQYALLERRITECEQMKDNLGDMKDSIAKINVTLAKIETILELVLKKELK